MIVAPEARLTYLAIRVYRNKLRRTILEAAEESGVEVRYGMRGLGVNSETSSQATVSFENGVDGVNSEIRTHIHPHIKSEYTRD